MSGVTFWVGIPAGRRWLVRVRLPRRAGEALIGVDAAQLARRVGAGRYTIPASVAIRSAVAAILRRNRKESR